MSMSQKQIKIRKKRIRKINKLFAWLKKIRESDRRVGEKF